jgi:hypothetical protein
VFSASFKHWISCFACLSSGVQGFPIALAPVDRELMRPCNIQDVDGPACVERIGAQHDHFLTSDRLIKLLFVRAEFLPMICFDSESVSADPYSRMASGQCCAELRVPAAGDQLQIATLQQLDLSDGPMPVEVRNSAG